MAPLLLKVKGNKSFSPFSNLHDEESLTRTWRVCTKVAAHLEQGQRLENLSWRLWYLHDLMVENDDVKSRRDFKKLSKSTGEKLDRDKGRKIGELTAPPFRKTDSGEMLRKKAVERQKLRALAVAKLQGKFGGKSGAAAAGGKSMKDMQYTFALDPTVNFKQTTIGNKDASRDYAAAQRQNGPVGTTNKFSLNLSPQASTSASSASGSGSGGDAMELGGDSNMVDAGASFDQIMAQAGLGGSIGNASGGYRLEDIEAAERDLLMNHNIDLNAPLDSLLEGLGSMEDVQMDLADLGLPVGDLPNFNAPFDQVLTNISAPQAAVSTGAAAGPSRLSTGPAKLKQIRRKKTDPQPAKVASELARRKAEELRTFRKLAEQTQRTHIQNSSRPESKEPSPDGSVGSGGGWSGNAQQSDWLASATSLFDGGNQQQTLSQSLPEGAHLPLSGYGVANSQNAGAGLRVDTSGGAMQPPAFGARGTSVSVPTTPLLAPEAGPFQGADRPVDSLSAPSSPTLRPMLANIGRSGSSPGPSTAAGVSKAAIKRHSTDSMLTGSDGQPKPKGRGRRSIAGSIAFTAINPDLNKKSADSLPASTSTTPTASAFPSGSGHPTQAQCTNCGATSTPLWRRDPNDLLLCNACGLYLKLHKAPRPKSLKNHHSHSHSGHMTPSATPGGASAPGSRAGSPSRPGSPTEDMMSCFNCGTYTTPLWRKDDAGHTVCNACGLYLKLHNEHRPVTMRADVIKKRSRYDEKRAGGKSGANSRRTSPQPQEREMEVDKPAVKGKSNVTFQLEENKSEGENFGDQSWPSLGVPAGGEGDVANQLNSAFATAINRFSTGAPDPAEWSQWTPQPPQPQQQQQSRSGPPSMTDSTSQEGSCSSTTSPPNPGAAAAAATAATDIQTLSAAFSAHPALAYAVHQAAEKFPAFFAQNPLGATASVAAAAGLSNPFANVAFAGMGAGGEEAGMELGAAGGGVGTPSNFASAGGGVVDAPMEEKVGARRDSVKGVHLGEEGGTPQGGSWW